MMFDMFHEALAPGVKCDVVSVWVPPLFKKGGRSLVSIDMG